MDSIEFLEKRKYREVLKWDFSLWERIKILFCKDPTVTVKVLVDGNWDIIGTVKKAKTAFSNILLHYEKDFFVDEELF